MLALTFDNLGEAAELERGEDAPHPHPSVTEALPRLLDELDQLNLRATFFVEAVNCETYPDAVTQIAARGHDVGMHGWAHERWARLSPQREDTLLERGRAAFTELGLTPRGFRPPGGVLPLGSEGHLRRNGFEWWSAVGGGTMPFAWEAVDAYHRIERLSGRPPLTPDATADALIACVDAGTPTLILHPFLMLGDESWAAARRVLAHVGQLDQHDP